MNTLPRASYEKLVAHMEFVTMERGTELYSVGQPIDYMYFPVTALTSLIGMTLDGQGTELGMVGDEGFLGVPLLFGRGHKQYSTVVQIEGSLWRMPKAVLTELKRDRSPFVETLYEYSNLRNTQIIQSAICNRFHTLKQRLSRWLLTMATRADQDELLLTQEFLSQMVGARRPAVAVAMGQLQRKGLITYTRGHICLEHRKALEASACECYSIINKEIRAFLSS